jgi:hypothetical protein
LDAALSSTAVISLETWRGEGGRRELRRGRNGAGRLGGEEKGECRAATAGNFVNEFSACVSE